MNDELAAFDESVAGVVEKYWGDATAAASADVADLWSAAVEQGWFELSSAGALDLAVAASRRLGRAACPLPLLDGYAATELLPTAGVDRGDVRVVISAGADTLVDSGGAASHVLIVPKGGARASLQPIVEATPLPGLAVPAWSSGHVGGQRRRM